MKPNIYIDKSPLPLLFLKEYKSTFILIFAGSLFFFFIRKNNIPQGISIQAYQTLIIFILAIFLWVTDIIPLAVTSLMTMGLLSIFHVLEARKIYSFFGNESVFFIIGAFIIAACISSSGLSERFAYFVLAKFGDTPYKLVLSIFFLSAFLSHWMPEHAVAAILFPILVSISQRLMLKPGSILGKYMFFALAWGCIIGGVVTFLGGARNPLAIGILQETTGESIAFLEWMVAVAPPSYVLMAILAVYLKRKVRASTKNTKLLEGLLASNRKRNGKMNFREIKALVILSGTIFMWVFYSKQFGIANIALISAALFFVFNVIQWNDAKKEINWDAIFMYGGAIALGKCLEETGLLAFISERYISNLQFSFIVFMVVIVTLSIFLTEGMSNAAVIVILLPIVMQIVVNLGLSPKLAVYLVAVPAGLAFMFPISSPPNAIAYSSGFFKSSEQLKIGLVLNIVSMMIYIGFALWYWPMIGIY